MAKLQAKIHKLQEKLYKFTSSHEACCMHGRPPSSSSSDSSDKASNHSSSLKPPFTLYAKGPEGFSINNHPPFWLVTTLKSPDMPISFKGNLVSPPPPPYEILVAMAVDAIKLMFKGLQPFLLSILQDNILVIATSASQGQVSATIKLPPNPFTPKIHS
ncbi:hypothetical protein EDC04DRAFT_2605179 [Pisolithus marmoratus]|nr:hypothetical protein EDC04DRAFT_2605179 [Pisolithus marmoratus]